MAEKTRYSDSELLEFKELILAKLDRARIDLEIQKKLLKNENGTDDTAPGFNGIDEGGQHAGSSEEVGKAIARQAKFIGYLQAALVRIENKTYGICRVTGKLISKERLRVVPHATLCIEAKNLQTAGNQRR